MSGQNILVAGTGIAGLGVALAFGNSDYRVTLIDRDPATGRDQPVDGGLRRNRPEPVVVRSDRPEGMRPFGTTHHAGDATRC